VNITHTTATASATADVISSGNCSGVGSICFFYLKMSYCNLISCFGSLEHHLIPVLHAKMSMLIFVLHFRQHRICVAYTGWAKK